AWLHYWNHHWFRGNYQETVGHDCDLDFDFHYLCAAIAPRLLYVSDGDTDTYADAEGEFLSCVEASKAWKIFGAEGLGTETFPPCGKLIGKEVGFYLRQGNHDFTPENWDALIRYASKHFF
ncbi:MAG: acetylxylan esterase, partial [Lentisphaeria bacterium]|nr:acetylxylan esterase [Lentisphaeria bacterium]